MADLPARPAVTRRVREINAGFEASPFSRLAITHALSTAGDAFVTVALAGSLFFDISPHAARGRVALSLLLTMTPFAVVAPFLGPAIDKIKGGRRLMIVLSCAGRVLVCLAMGQAVHNLLLFPAAFGALVLSRTYAVAKSSLVPTVVDDEDR
ncbi:MAG: MFS transporter, partial [Actinobacteria bacterium]|nr:MFS transporter [Actinomycetota bacterium]